MMDVLNCTREKDGMLIERSWVLVEVNAIITACIAFGSIIGNFLIILAFYKRKSLRSVNNTFLVQLAVVDGTKAVFILTTKTFTQLAKACNVAKAYCQFSGFISSITFTHSALLLAAIAVVRYFKMVRSASFDRVFSRSRTILYSCLIALSTTLLALLPIFKVGVYRFSPYHGVCFANWSKESLPYRTTFYVYTIGVCYSAIIFCYTNIFIKLREHQKTMSRLHMARTQSQDGSKTLDSNPPQGAAGKYAVKEGRSLDVSLNTTATVNSSESKRNDADKNRNMSSPQAKDLSVVENYSVDEVTRNRISLQEEQEVPATENSSLNTEKESHDTDRCANEQTNTNGGNHPGMPENSMSPRLIRNELRVTKVMFAIVVAYSICWLPAFVVNITMFATKPEKSQNSDAVPPNILYLIITLVDLKVFLNPLIYGIWNFQFQREIKSLICGCWK